MQEKEVLSCIWFTALKTIIDGRYTPQAKFSGTGRLYFNTCIWKVYITMIMNVKNCYLSFPRTASKTQRVYYNYGYPASVSNKIYWHFVWEEEKEHGHPICSSSGLKMNGRYMSCFCPSIIIYPMYTQTNYIFQ